MQNVEVLLSGRPHIYVFTINDSCREVPNFSNSKFILYTSPFVEAQANHNNNVLDGCCFASYQCEPGNLVIDTMVSPTEEKKMDDDARQKKERMWKKMDDDAKQNKERLSVIVPQWLARCY